MADTQREIDPPTIEEAEFGDDITMRRGPVWALVSVPSLGPDGGLDVKVECGPAIGIQELRNLLTRTLEAL
jgi:hypothetical protein